MYISRRDIEELLCAKLFKDFKKYYFLFIFQTKYNFIRMVIDVYILL